MCYMLSCEWKVFIETVFVRPPDFTDLSKLLDKPDLDLTTCGTNENRGAQ